MKKIYFSVNFLLETSVGTQTMVRYKLIGLIMTVCTCMSVKCLLELIIHLFTMPAPNKAYLFIYYVLHMMNFDYYRIEDQNKSSLKSLMGHPVQRKKNNVKKHY